MGLYIDIEMPKGELGAIPIMIYANGNVEHFFSNEKYGKVIEVPEPHGRLIDADALNYTMLYKENWMRGTGIEAPAVWRKDIDAAPTIIPASERGLSDSNV